MTTDDTAHPEASRSHELHRYLTFVDAVAAIALTLLVLPLSDLGADLGSGDSVADMFRDHGSQFFGFLLSFVVIADLWFVQSRVMRPIMKMHPLVSRALLVWAFTIVVLPFCTELVAQAGTDPLSKLCYFGAIAISEGSLAVIGETARRHPNILDPDDTASDPAAAWLTMGLLIAGLVISLVIPALSYYPLLLLVVGHPLQDLVRRRRAAGSGHR